MTTDVRTNALSRRFAAGATVLAVAGAGMLVAEAANAQTPPGTITFNPPAGTDQTIIAGITSGPCDVGDSDALQVFVTGPGPFAAGAFPDTPNGVTFRGAQTEGFSKTDPNVFSGRVSFVDLAREVGLSAVPVGTYTVDFRCVGELSLQVFQTYSSTITFTTPTTYATSGARPPAPGTTSDSSTITPATTTSEGATTSSDPLAETHPFAPTDSRARTGASIGLIFLGSLILVAAGLALVVWLQRRRRRS